MWPQLVLVVGLGLGVAGTLAGVFYEGKRAGRNECQAAAVTINEAATRAADAAASAAADAISKIEVRNVTVKQTLEREVLTREVFRTCRSGDDAVRLLNSTPGIAAPAASAPGDGLVPATRAPG